MITMCLISFFSIASGELPGCVTGTDAGITDDGVPPHPVTRPVASTRHARSSDGRLKDKNEHLADTVDVQAHAIIRMRACFLRTTRIHSKAPVSESETRTSKSMAHRCASYTFASRQ